MDLHIPIKERELIGKEFSVCLRENLQRRGRYAERISETCNPGKKNTGSRPEENTEDNTGCHVPGSTGMFGNRKLSEDAH